MENTFLTLNREYLSIINNMKAKEQVIFDIQAEKFKYLHRDETKIKNRVNIDTLNKRLNEVKKLNFYSNAKMIIVTLLVVAAVILISLKF